jgi:hypothetical protein
MNTRVIAKKWQLVQEALKEIFGQMVIVKDMFAGG